MGLGWCKDERTRACGQKQRHKTESSELALAWFHSGNDTDARTMIVLPYKDRLPLFSKCLQQLIMDLRGLFGTAFYRIPPLLYTKTAANPATLSLTISHFS